MMPGIAAQPGDVALVLFPFTDLSGAKLRPAVVLARGTRDDIVLAFVTTQSVPEDERATTVVLNPGDEEFALTGLARRSTVRLTRLVTLNSTLVRRKLGILGPETLAEVRVGLRVVFGI